MLGRGFKGSLEDKEEICSDINLAFYGPRPSSASPRRLCGTPILLQSPSRTQSKNENAKASPVRYTTSFTGPKLFDSPNVCQLELKFQQVLIDSSKKSETISKQNRIDSDSDESIYEDAVDSFISPGIKKNENICSVL